MGISSRPPLPLSGFLYSLTHKWLSIIKPEGRGPNDSSDLAYTFCISSQTEVGMMPPNPTHTSPKHVRQGITTIQLGRYGQISLCDWILCREKRLRVSCGDGECVFCVFECVCVK